MQKFRHKWLLLWLFVFLFTFDGYGQTKSDLRQKYKFSEMVETYQVKSGILAIVFYNETGKVNNITLLPPVTLGEYRVRKMEMPENLIAEAIEELIPEAKRGKLCQDTGIKTIGKITDQTINFENVSISYTKNVGRSTFRSVRIEMIGCQEYNLRQIKEANL